MMRALWSRVCLAAALLAALTALPPPPAVAQTPNSSYAGTTVLRFLMGPNLLKLQPLKAFDDLAEEPAKKLLVVFGDPGPLERWGTTNLKRFLNGGGALLVATDHATGKCLSEVFHARVTGQRLHAMEPSGKYLGKLDDCPVVEKVSNNAGLFQRVGSLVTNLPSDFELRSTTELQARMYSLATGQEIVGQLPRTVDRRRHVSNHRPCALIYRWGTPGCRVLLLSDQDMFIDGMMFQKQNDNFVFAYNSLRWLTDSGRRTQVLFFDNGEIVTDLNVPLKWAPRPALPPPVAIADHMLAGLEQENAFNRLLHSLIPHRAILALVAVFVTLVLAARWLYHLLTRRVRVEGDLSLATTGSQPSARLPSLMKERHEAMLKAGNLWEVAHDLARHCFEDHVSAPQPTRPGSTIHGPALAVAGPPWQRWQLRRRARQLWQLAYGTRPRIVTRRELKQLVTWSEDVQTALADGRLRLTGATPSHGRKDNA